MITHITAYDLLILAYPNVDIHYLSNILDAKKEALEKLFGMPILQRTPLGLHCKDLAEYRERLNITVGVGSSCIKYLKEQILKETNSNPSQTNKLFEILGINRASLISC